MAQRADAAADVAMFDEAVAVLETAHDLDRGHVGALEFLAYAYSKDGRSTAKWHAALRELERVAPDSPVLQLAGESDEATTSALAIERWALANVLVRLAFEGSTAARNRLRVLNRAKPADLTLLGALMFAEEGLGETDAALRLADELSARPGIGYTEHFNLAQVYWGAGRYADARSHLDLAAASAADDREREDFLALRKVLESRRHL